MASCITDFYRKVQPLMDLLEEAYRITGKRKRSATKRIELFKFFQDTTHEATFIDISESFKRARRLTYPEIDNIISV